MKIETGWVNDDFVNNIITIRIDDHKNQLMITFKAQINKPKMTSAVCMRLNTFKAIRRFNNYIKAGVKGRVYYTEVL